MTNGINMLKKGTCGEPKRKLFPQTKTAAGQNTSLPPPPFSPPLAPHSHRFRSAVFGEDLHRGRGWLGPAKVTPTPHPPRHPPTPPVFTHTRTPHLADSPLSGLVQATYHPPLPPPPPPTHPHTCALRPANTHHSITEPFLSHAPLAPNPNRTALGVFEVRTISPPARARAAIALLSHTHLLLPALLLPPLPTPPTRRTALGVSNVETMSPASTSESRSVPSKSACSMDMTPASASRCSGRL